MSTDHSTEGLSGVRAARVGLVVTAVAITAAWILGALDFFELGLTEAPPRASEVGERVIDMFFVQAEAYLRWGLWIDVATAVAFAGLLVVVPSLRHARGARGPLIGGATVAVVADAMDLSKVIAFDTGRFVLDQGLSADFAAANMARHMLDGTSTYLWVAGLVLVAVGLSMVAAEAGPGWWRTVTWMLCASLLAVAISDVVAALRGGFEAAFTMMTASLVAWTIVARGHLVDGPPGALDGRGQGPSVGPSG